MNFSRASNSIVRAVRRRLETARPPAQLVEDSIKRMALPGTPNWGITVFICAAGGKRYFTAEFTEPDLPHVYQTFPLPANDKPKQIAEIMMKAIVGLTRTIASDRRFKRNIITLSPGQLNGALKQLTQGK